METDDIQQTKRRKKFESKEVIDVPRIDSLHITNESIRILHGNQKLQKIKKDNKGNTQ
jgi:hypothetical protein